MIKTGLNLPVVVVMMIGAISLQFLGQNIHFAIYLFAALACFAAGWLYLDAWAERRTRVDLPKWTGFFLLAVGFLVEGAVWDAGLLDATGGTLKLLGYIGLIIGNLLEPIQPRPKTSHLEPQPPEHHDATNSAPPASPTAPATSAPPTNPAPATNQAAPAALAVTAAQGLTFALPVAALAIATLYWRRATTGLERHLKPIAGVFAAMTLADVFAVAKLWRSSDNPLVQQFTGPLGPLWILEHLALLGAGLWLMWWVWHYLTKRFLTQFFLIITTFTVTIVLVATVSITSLLLSSLQRDSLASLETAAKVLGYAITSQTAETRSGVTVLAQNPATASAATTGNHAAAAGLAGDLLVRQHLTEVIITNDSGQVLARASDPDRYGDSISDDSLVKRALVGTTVSSTATRTGALAPELIITTASPIRAGNRIVGTALASLALDNAFVDGIKRTTGLDSAVYAGDTRSATTLVSPDGTSRSIGAKETHTAVLDRTLRHGQIWQGALSVSNQTYLATYLPLKDVDNTVVGLLFVGQVQDALLQSASAAIKLTFAMAVLWLLLIMVPIYFISRLIARQLR
jgi:hypothetical protein